jgi:hypothetical protein
MALTFNAAAQFFAQLFGLGVDEAGHFAAVRFNCRSLDVI